MRSLKRPQVAPPTLTNIQTPAAELNQKSASQFDSKKWNSPDVRGALLAMHGYACAYCQMEILDTTDVEHFRPKSKYPWLAYSFSNYLLSCVHCNQREKRDDFPLKKRCKPVRFERRGWLPHEKRLLLDPACDPIEEWVELEFRDQSFEWKAAASLQDEDIHKQVETSRICFEWNTRLELILERVRYLGDAMDTIQAAKDGDEQQILELHEMAVRYRKHGMAVRRMTERLAPELLPGESYELCWLLTEFVKRLKKIAQKLPTLTPQEEKSRLKLTRQREEIYWALATVLVDPPIKDSPTVEKWLRNLTQEQQLPQLLDELKEYRKALSDPNTS